MILNSLFLTLAVGTNIDPSLCRADGLVGQILGACDTLPKVYLTITIKYNLLRHLIGEQIRVCISFIVIFVNLMNVYLFS